MEKAGVDRKGVEQQVIEIARIALGQRRLIGRHEHGRYAGRLAADAALDAGDGALYVPYIAILYELTEQRARFVLAEQRLWIEQTETDGVEGADGEGGGGLFAQRGLHPGAEFGGGGAGASAAIEADNAGAKTMIVTKLRIGDANTMMAEGGIQAADKPNDSPAIHFLDAFGGGHFAAKKELLEKLVCDAPEAIQWLNDLGVEFDKAPDGTMITTHGGGTSRKRMHAAKDYSGAEIMRTLRDEVLNRGIPVVDFTSAIELILDENGKAAGAVLMNMETKELMVARAKTVIIATGGAGRMHYQGFPTSNHYGATADGLVLGYRVGAKLLYADTLQYHPTGAAFPQQIFGALVTEKVRSLGAKLVNRDGKVFMHPLETRDVAASIIRECSDRDEGIDTGNGKAVWLDTPMIEKIGGEGTIERRIPAMMRMFGSYGIDIRKEPILVYPTLHYQNGGLDIDVSGMTTNVENLFVAGEAVGGIHGRNRLMGNSLLDIIVFGRSAGKNAAEKSKDVKVGALTLDHIAKFDAEREAAGIVTDAVSPKLLPDYRRK